MTERWRPLRVRDSADPAVIEKHDALVEGVPPYLFRSLYDWLTESFVAPGHRYSSEPLQAIERNLQVTLSWKNGSHSAIEAFERLCSEDPQFLLEAVDYALSTELDQSAYSAHPAVVLLQILYEGGSAWTVRNDGHRLEHRPV